MKYSVYLFIITIENVAVSTKRLFLGFETGSYYYTGLEPELKGSSLLRLQFHHTRLYFLFSFWRQNLI